MRPLRFEQRWDVDRARYLAISVLLFIGGATADLAPLAIHLSLLGSDVALIGAGILALTIRRQELPTTFVRFLCGNFLVVVLAVLGLAFLLATGVSTLIAGAPRSGVETWLLFALLVGFVAPFTAVAVARHRHGLRALTVGLFCGGVLGATGFIAEAIDRGDAVLYGPRSDGLFDSDQLFLILIALAIALAHVIGSLMRTGVRALRSPLIVIESASIPFLGAAVVISRYRAAWVGSLVLIVLAVILATRSVRITALVAILLALTATGVYRFQLLPQPLIDRIDQTFGKSSDLSARREATTQLFDAWRERPWGVGLNESPRYVEPALVSGGNASVHNVVGHALVEGGPLAALAIAAAPFVLTALWLRIPRSKASPGAHWHLVWPMASFWAIFIAAQFTPSLYEHAAWITIGALVGIAVRNRVDDVQSH